MDVSFSATILFLYIYNVIELPQISSHNVKFLTGIKLENAHIPTGLGLFSGKSLIECAVECGLKNGECLAFEYHVGSKQCSLSGYFPPLMLSFQRQNGSKVYYYEDYDCNSKPYNKSVANTEVQTITAPNYPGPYSHNLDVTWQIIKPKSSTLFLNFQSFDLEFEEECEYDRLSIFTGNCGTDQLVDSVCGNASQTFQISSGLYVLIRFETDADNVDDAVHYGFVLNYYVNK